MTTTSRANRIQSFRTMINGVKTGVDPKASIPIKGIATPQPTVLGVLQAFIDASDAAEQAEAAFHEAVAKQEAALEAANGVFIGVRAFALAQFGNQPTVLGTFGLEVPVRKAPSAATKAAAVAKMKATRALRGTKGKVQKQVVETMVVSAIA